MIMYGMGASSLASSINGTVKEAEKIIKDFYDGFPKVKEWIDYTHTSAAELGYVEDFWGRRRRLPDILLPPYQVYPEGTNGVVVDFNPIFGCHGLNASPVNPKIQMYVDKLLAADGKKAVAKIKKEAQLDGLEVKDNTYWISQAERQCVNARIQGSAASMSKKAMIKVHTDEELNRLGFRLMIAIHDELIGECPAENAEAVADRLTYVMRTCALPEVNVPFKCDPTIEPVWYYSDYSAKLQAQYDEIKGDNEKFEKFIEEHSECTREQIYKILGV